MPNATAGTLNTDKPKKKRTPKRLTEDALRERIKERIDKAKQDGKDYRGAALKHVKWDTLRYDEKAKRQVVDIETVDENGKPDGGTRTVATSDLQHVRHSVEIAQKIQKERNNARRREKRQTK